MFENFGIQSLTNLAQDTADKGEPSSSEVVVVGLGAVFAGLISIVIICKIVGLFCGAGKKEKKTENAAPAVAPVASAPIENRGEIIAAVCAAAAEELGTDVSAIRVRSFKKL